MKDVSDEKALSRRECDRCTLRTEVDNLGKWVSKIDGRMWAALFVATVNMIGIVTTLIILLTSRVPAAGK